MTSSVRGRLAPSPTGALHLGNARTFLLCWLSVRAQGGTVVLRIEDLDGPRVKPGTTEALVNDLRWLGLDWDEGPDLGGPYAPYVQTERGSVYAEAIERLRNQDRIYACTCSRTDIQNAASAPHLSDEGPRYPGTCRLKQDQQFTGGQPNRSPAWRVIVPPGDIEFVDDFLGRQSFNVAMQVGDFVVQKNSNTAAYQLSVVVDDAAMKIDEVVRGDDLLSSTPRQMILQRYLDLPTPRYYHVPLIVGKDGLRLAKRHGDTRVSMFRELGIAPGRLVGLLAHWSGLADERESLEPHDLIARFNWAAIPKTQVICVRDDVLRQLANP